MTLWGTVSYQNCVPDKQAGMPVEWCMLFEGGIWSPIILVRSICMLLLHQGSLPCKYNLDEQISHILWCWFKCPLVVITFVHCSRATGSIFLPYLRGLRLGFKVFSPRMLSMILFMLPVSSPFWIFLYLVNTLYALDAVIWPFRWSNHVGLPFCCRFASSVRSTSISRKNRDNSAGLSLSNPYKSFTRGYGCGGGDLDFWPNVKVSLHLVVGCCLRHSILKSAGILATNIKCPHKILELRCVV